MLLFWTQNLVKDYFIPRRQTCLAIVSWKIRTVMNTFILFVLLSAVKEKNRKQTIAYSLSAAFILSCEQWSYHRTPSYCGVVWINHCSRRVRSYLPLKSESNLFARSFWRMGVGRWKTFGTKLNFYGNLLVLAISWIFVLVHTGLIFSVGLINFSNPATLSQGNLILKILNLPRPRRQDVE